MNEKDYKDRINGSRVYRRKTPPKNQSPKKAGCQPKTPQKIAKYPKQNQQDANFDDVISLGPFLMWSVFFSAFGWNLFNWLMLGCDGAHDCRVGRMPASFSLWCHIPSLLFNLCNSSKINKLLFLLLKKNYQQPNTLNNSTPRRQRTYLMKQNQKNLQMN